MINRKLEGDSTFFYENDSLILTMVETDTEDGILMTLKGDLKKDTANPILDELNDFSMVNVKVTVDFKDVTSISAAVMNALLDAQQQIDQLEQGELVLRSIPDPIYREMDKIHLTELLMIEE